MGTLTIGHSITVEAQHCLPALPSWHPCAKWHGHHYQIDLELAAPREKATDEVSIRLKEAVGLLDSFDGPLRMRDISTLPGIDKSAHSAALTLWVHQWVTERLPEGVGDYLLVRVQDPAVDYRPAVHAGPLVPTSQIRADDVVHDNACRVSNSIC